MSYNKDDAASFLGGMISVMLTTLLVGAFSDLTIPRLLFVYGFMFVWGVISGIMAKG